MFYQLQKPPIIVSLGDDVTMTFLHIPAGRFRMGQRGGETNEEPVTDVEVDEFWMGETPVTQEQYRVMAEGCTEKLSSIEGNLGSEPSHFKDREDSAMRPVEHVNWFDARVVADWLQEKMRVAGTLPTGCVVDLPPEDHWEYACRAGTETDYWSGTGDAALAQAGWYGGNASGETHPAREKKPNNFGLYDMHGNVNEWCLDLYEAVKGRLRKPCEQGAAFLNFSQLIREPAKPKHIAWADLFENVSNGKLELSADEVVLIEKLRWLTKNYVEGGDPGWGIVVDACNIAISLKRWPEDLVEIANFLCNYYRGNVYAASEKNIPDRVVRGGPYLIAARYCKSALRHFYRPWFRQYSYGFRLCVFLGTAKQEPEAKQEAESATAAMEPRNEAQQAQAEDDAAWDDTKLPPRSGGDLF